MDPVTFGLGTATGAGALWLIQRLQQLKNPAEGLGDLLGWAFMIDEGIILMKDGSFLSGIELNPPDLEASSSADVNSVTDTVHDMLMLLGEGYGIEVNVHRNYLNHYPIDEKHHFPTDSLRAMEEERQKQFRETKHHYLMRRTVLFTYTPSKELWSKWERPIIKGTQNEFDYQQILSDYKRTLTEVHGLLKSRFEASLLSNSNLLTECHSTLTGTLDQVQNTSKSYLSYSLASDDFQTGFYPKVSGQHIFVITISSLGVETRVAGCDFLNRLEGEWRWHMRYVGMSRHGAERRIKRLQTSWFHQRRGLRKLIAPKEEGFEDQDAVNMQQESATAHAESSSGRVRFGYFTNALILRDSIMKRGLAQSQILMQGLRDQGFTCSLETINATDAFIGTLPGHGHANLRRPLLSSRNIAHLFPVSAPWRGAHSCPSPLFEENSPALACAKTSGGIPFMVNLHQGDVGHTLVIGATGSGKSVLVGWLALNFLRYANSRVHIFDIGKSHQVSGLASGGSQYSFGETSTNALQPLRHIDQKNERLWALSWLEIIYDLSRELVDAEGRLILSETLDLLSQSPPEFRTLTAYHLLLPQTLKSVVAQYTEDGPYGQLFDGDTVADVSKRFQVYELGNVLDQGDSVMVPLLLSLFRNIERTLDGTPTLIVIEEAWAALLRSQFSERIKAWLLTLRKRNAAVILVAHSPAQIMALPNAALITESCPTKIILPNSDARTEEGLAMYRALDLNPRAIELIASATPKREYFYKRPQGGRLFELNLGPIARTLLIPPSGKDASEGHACIGEAILQNE
ncbi:MAG: hypothetical protein OXF08_11090 [Bacteroidetes bacterium]|nr:hypothetical protein [Bacteroidota bacterium]